MEELSCKDIFRKIIARYQKTSEALFNAENDWRLKTAMKDRLPPYVKTIFEVGDKVVFRDGKDRKRHDARIVGFDGSVALISWGNMDRSSQVMRK